MFESGLRFVFAFLPAGVAVVVGLVLAIGRRRTQPDVATPAIWGLALQLVAIVAGASINVVPSAVVQGGGDPRTALTISTVISLVTAALTVVSWVLILTALFRRLPAAAGAVDTDAPTRAVPTPAAGYDAEPFADDAPTGRHALLDEHGQQVVAQAGVRLSPQTAGLAAGGAGLGAAAAFGSGAFAAAPGREHTEDLPTEAVPVMGREPGGPGDRTVGTVDEAGTDQPDPGPVGVDESAVGGTPTGPERDSDEDADPVRIARPTAPAPSDPGPAGVDEAAVGGTPTGADTPDDTAAPGEGDTALTPAPDAHRAADGVAAAAEIGVDEAAVGGTPISADADPGTPPTGDEPTSTPGTTRPAPAPSSPIPGATSTPAAGSGAPGASSPAASTTAASAPAASSSPASTTAAASDPAGASSPTDSTPTGSTPPAVATPDGATPATPTPSAPTPAAGSTPTAPAADEPESDDASSGPAAPASHPGLAGTMRSPRPTPPPGGGSDLFSPSAPVPEVSEEAVGGTPAEPQETRTPRPRTSRAPVAGWFEPVTDGAADGFGSENREN